MNLLIVTQVLGIVLTVAGFSMFSNRKGVSALLEDTTRNQGVLWFYGLIALISGAVLVSLNNVWSSGIQLLVTIIGWLALIKGISVLIFPHFTVSLYKKMNNPTLLASAGVVAFVVGLILLYAGFM